MGKELGCEKALGGDTATVLSLAGTLPAPAPSLA